MITGFCSAGLASQKHALTDAQCVERFKAQVFALFPGCAGSFLEGAVLHWGLEEHVGLGYSGFAGPGVRRAARAPLSGKVHFAGEAFSEEQFGCISGALETGTAAANQALHGTSSTAAM